MANARYIAANGVQAFLHPEVDVFESFNTTSSGTFAEVPILATFIGIAFHALNSEPEWLARVITILFSLLGSIYFYRLVKVESDEKTARIASFFYLIAPMNWFFHRTVITDVPMVSFVIMGLFYFRQWMVKEDWKSFALSIVFTALAAMAKAYALYIGLAYLGLLLTYKGIKKLITLPNIIYLIGSTGPVFGWIYYCSLNIAHGEAGRNLTAGSELLGSLDIWFQARYWSRLLSSTGDLTLLPLGFLVFLYTVCKINMWRTSRLTVLWMGSAFFYFLFVRQGNITHDYYQMPLAAPLIMWASFGWRKLFDRVQEKYSHQKAIAIISAVAVVMILNAGKYSFTKAKLDMSPVELGRQIAEMNPNRDYVLIIDPDYLQRNQAVYYTRSKGWHTKQLPDMKTLETYRFHGAKWFGLNLKEDEVQGNKELLAEYDKKLGVAWKGYSTDRYKKKKYLFVYPL